MNARARNSSTAAAASAWSDASNFASIMVSLAPLEKKLLEAFNAERARSKQRRSLDSSPVLCILRAMVWVSDPSSDALIDTVQSGLRMVSSFHARCILDGLNERVALTPLMAPSYLKILVAEFQSSPGAANVETALSSFASCLAFGPQVRLAVLRSAFGILDGAVSLGEDADGVGAWVVAMYYFLGEYAFQLDAVFADDSVSAPSSSSAHSSPSANRSFDAAYSSVPSNLTALRPPMLRRCAMYLARGMVLGHWQSRRICVDSLLKLAIVNSGNCRQAVRGLFETALENEGFEELGIADKLSAALEYLHDVKSASEAVASGQRERSSENRRLLKEASVWTSIPVSDFAIIK